MADPEPTPTPEPTPEPAPAPAPAPTLVQPPATQLDWKAMRATLPAGLRDSTVLNQFDESGFEGLVNDRITLDAALGREKVPKPPENATPEDMDRYFNALGRPKEPGDYDLGDFKPPENVPWDADLQTNMLEDFHAAGLTNEQVQAVVSAYANRQGESFEQSQLATQQAAKQSEETLRSELGESYDAAVEMGGRAFEAAFGDQMEQLAGLPMPDGHLFGDHPVIVRGFIELGKQLAEHGLAGPKHTTAQIGMTPEQAQAEIEKLEHPGSDTAKAIVSKSHPDHKAVKARWRALHEAANAGA